MKRVCAAIALMVLFAACNPKQSQKRNAIEAAEKKLMEDAKAGKVDSTSVANLLSDYEYYAENYPSDTLGAVYLFKAADFYRYQHKPLKSIETYSRIYELYPTILKRPYALFLQGFIYENEINNTQAAKSIYEKFIETYPDHPIVNDVKTTLGNLGKTPEQLIAEFQERHIADSLAAADK